MDSRKNNKNSSKQSQPIISKDDIQYLPAIDTYVNRAKLVKTIAVDANKRKSFFAERPHVKVLLKREKQNPLLEEGNFSHFERDHEGEFYLTYEALTLLIETKIRQHKNIKGELPYNAKNIYVVKNDRYTLIKILINLDLQPGDDAKIIYISGVHAVPFYLRKEADKIKCFVVDSEAGVFDWPREIIESVKNAYPSAHITLSNTVLQKDFYSCATIAFKNLLFFVKHGREIFPYLEKTSSDYHAEICCHVLLKEKLMPELLKMCQSQLQLSDETLDTIVCHKRKITLRVYLEKYRIHQSGKFFNSAALIKKYLYLNTLNDYLAFHAKDEKIENDSHSGLPQTLLFRHALFSRVKSKKSFKKNIINQYRQLIQYCDEHGNSTTNIMPELIQKIVNKFPLFLTRYNAEFDSTNDTEELKIKKLLFISAYSEMEDPRHIIMYLKFAANLYRLFADFDTVCEYLRHHVLIDAKQPIHDACLFELPNEHESWNRAYWANLSIKYGLGVVKYLALASRIELRLANYTENEKKDLAKLSELEQIKKCAISLSYKNAQKNPELALLCVTHHRPEEDFEGCLELVETKLKLFDVLPDFEIKGSDIDPTLAKFRFAKLPIHDLRGLFLGEYTACCQSYNKIGSACAIYGMTSIYGGFYVIYDHWNRIIAQSFAWVGKNGELVLDSWEYINKTQKYLFKPFVEKAAAIILEYGFTRVLVGVGGNTPEKIFATTKEPAEPISDISYSDAHVQDLVKSAVKLTLLERFRLHANKYQLDFAKYSSLFTQDNDLDFVRNQLTQMISSNHLPYSDFIKIYKFLIVSFSDLFKQSKSQQLIETALETYGSDVYMFYSMPTDEGITWLEYFVRLDDIELLAKLIKSFDNKMKASYLVSDNINIERLMHIAAKYDAVKNLTYLYNNYFQEMSWDDYCSLKAKDGLSVFFYAVKYQASKCVELMLSHLKDKTKISEILAQSESRMTIFHYLAQRGELVILQKLCHFYQNDSKLHDFFSESAVIPSAISGVQVDFCGPVFLSAIIYDHRKIIDFILKNYYTKNTFYQIFNRKSLLSRQSLLGILANKNAVERLHYLYQFYPNESEWHASLMQEQGYFTVTLLGKLLQAHAFDSIVFFLNSYTSFELLHEFITTGNSLDQLQFESSIDGTNKIIRKICEIYTDHQQELHSLFNKENFPILKGIVKQGNTILFSELLAILRQDECLFNQLIQKKSHNDYNLLESIIGWLVCGEPALAEETQIKFIDILLAHCTNEQKKLLLKLHNYLLYISKSQLVYLLSKISEIDEGKFAAEFLLSENNKTIPFIAVLYNYINSSEATQVIIEYYARYIKIENIGTYLNSSVLINSIASLGNLYLLQYTFTSNKHDLTILLPIYTKLIASHKTHSLPVLSWLLEQEEISNTLLKQGFQFELNLDSTKDPDKHWPHSATHKLLWDACKSRMNQAELYEIIKNNFLPIIKNIIYISQYNDKFFGRKQNSIYSALMLINTWLMFCKANSLDYYNLIVAKDDHGQNAFHYACELKNTDLIKLLFLSCNRQERSELINEYELANKKDPHFLKLLKEIMLQFKKLDQILIIQTIKNVCDSGGTSSALFYKPQLTVVANSTPLPCDVNKICYTTHNNKDEFDSELHIVSDEYIDKTYEAWRAALQVKSLDEIDFKVEEEAKVNARVSRCVVVRF